jgi:hypothetical protein
MDENVIIRMAFAAAGVGLIIWLSQRICGWERTKHPTYEVREQRRSYARMRSRGG